LLCRSLNYLVTLLLIQSLSVKAQELLVANICSTLHLNSGVVSRWQHHHCSLYSIPCYILKHYLVSSSLIFISCRYKCTAVNLFILHRIIKSLFLYFFKYNQIISSQLKFVSRYYICMSMLRTKFLYGCPFSGQTISN